ncbi:TIGR02444 family protein [Pseudorhodoplanes sp.]|uniref:TIGR02444 family protein n=1 Tax=Pseudorhodoplanes sp. TaxID=1934341 RepID=UPI002BEEB30F|nr:TIGR02444 family protein [Pseudorhodoplanes sp.]HWV51063.1 TIGR02444 family protein [Pseudorhodoplanes sp.]
MPPLQIDNPFWRFSLQVYGTAGVADECISVQDKLGIDVNVLLFAAWLGAARGVVIRDADIQRISAAVATWSADVVQPLRVVRRGLKQNMEIADVAVQALRKQVAGAELFAEQVEQAMLFRMADDLGEKGAGSDHAARANLSVVLASSGAGVDPFPLPKLVAAVSLACG